MSLLTPPPLQKGDTIAVVGLASKVEIADIQAAIQLMQNEWGLSVLVGESVNAQYFNFAGTDEVRRKDFQAMLDNPAVKAVIAARGGYGSARIIEQIDFTNFIKNPKWVIGFSDITEVLCKIQTLGFQALHAPMPKTMLRDTGSTTTLEAWLFGKKIDYKIPPHPMNRLGVAQGELTGGNLCMLTHTLATSSAVETAGKILFIEDIAEYAYSIDRMLVQLKRAKQLENLAGLVVGTFTDVKESDEPFGKTIYEIVAEHVTDYTYPVCYGFPVGHEAMNWTLPCGHLATLGVSHQEVSLVFW